MAGAWADPTSWRMALDLDGSKMVLLTAGGQLFEVTGGDFHDAVDDDYATYPDSNNDIGVPLNEVTGVAVVFPELRDIDGYLFAGISSSIDYTDCIIQTSVNTTNGFDGTWVTANGDYEPELANPFWRVGASFQTILAVRGIRMTKNATATATFFAAMQLRSIHIYGEIAPGQDLPRLAFWEPATDSKLGPAALDFGDVPRGSSTDRVVRVKNLSETSQANNVRVSFNILTDSTASGSPSVPSQFSVSYLGSPFAAQVNIGSLGPNTLSGLITIRRVTPTSAQLGHFAPRVRAAADSWT